MTPTITPATTTDPSQMIIPSVALETNSLLGRLVADSSLGHYLSGSAILHWLDILWSTYALLAYILCILMLLLYVYASTRYKQLLELREQIVKERERIYDERFRGGAKNNRLIDIETHIASDHPNDWKLAIIEADIILDETLKNLGYAGISLGERLRGISPNQLNSLDSAWQAHKVRNQIAHEGADFVLTKRVAQDTIKQYKIVFAELGVI